jgi:hypothetical protein
MLAQGTSLLNRLFNIDAHYHSLYQRVDISAGLQARQTRVLMQVGRIKRLKNSSQEK